MWPSRTRRPISTHSGQHPRAAVRRAPRARLRQQGRATARIPEDATVNIKNRSFTLTAELENPDGNAEGILVTVGRERYTITSTQPLPKGQCTIRFDFAYDGGGAGKGGTGTLSVNDKQVGEGRIDKAVPVVFSTDDTFDVGADWGTPVSPTYQPPFEFSGTLRQVTIEAT